jgi:hypothetical protein
MDSENNMNKINTNTLNETQKKEEVLLRNLNSNSVIKGLVIKNKVLRKENQKYFEFILELKKFLKLENNGIADRIMTLVDKNVDNIFLQNKLMMLQKNSDLLKNQNKEYQQDVRLRLNNLDLKVTRIDHLKKSFFQKMNVMFLENKKLQKIVNILVSSNMLMSQELGKTSQIIQNLVNDAQKEVDKASEILSKKFWGSLTRSWEEKKLSNQDSDEIFSQGSNREDQEKLLDQMKQSSNEENEERMIKVKSTLEEVCDYLNQENEKDSLQQEKKEFNIVLQQLSLNGEQIVKGLWSLWQKEKEESKIIKLKLESVISNKSNLLGKRELIES